MSSIVTITVYVLSMPIFVCEFVNFSSGGCLVCPVSQSFMLLYRQNASIVADFNMRLKVFVHLRVYIIGSRH